MNCGIYLITISTGHLPCYYVGQSVNIRSRKYAHIGSLRRGKHHNRQIQRAFNKYGEKSLSFSVLEYCEPCDLDAFEGWWLSEMIGFKRCLNVAADPSAPQRGRKLSESHRSAIAKSGRGLKRSDKTRVAISLATSGTRNAMFGVFGKMHSRSKAVYGRSLKTGDSLVYESACLAERDGFIQEAISRCCNGKQRTHLGFTWSFTTP